MTLVFALLLPGTAAYAIGSEKADISEAKSAVVRVLSIFPDGSIGSGSAFGVGKNGSTPEYFITNAHVCMDTDGNNAEAVFILTDSKAVHAKFYEDSRGEISSEIDDINLSKMVSCEVVNEKSISLFPDVAILKAEKPIEGRTCLPLHKSSNDLKDGSPVYALGYPGGSDVLALSYFTAEINDVALTSGVVSQKTNSELYGGTDVIVHSATISSGNSGGPLLDEKGAVVGINTYGHLGLENQYISIYIDYATDLLDEYNIPYTDADNQNRVKTIVVAAVIAVTVLVTGILISVFRKRGINYENRQLRLQGLNGYFSGRRFQIKSEPINIGCAPDNNLVFPTGTAGVSAHHCTIINENDYLYVRDNGSTYGTAINGNQKIPANTLVSIKVGDKIYLGSDQQSFQITYKGGKLSLSD